MRTKSIFLVGSIVAITLLLGACSRKFNPEVSCNFVQNSDLQRVSWNSATPVHLYIHKSLPLTKYPEMEEIIREAVASWNNTAGREVIRVEAFNVAGSDVPQKDGYSMVYWMDTWEAARANEQARTTIFWTGSQIYEADVRINARDHTYYVGEESTFSGVDFKSLVVHELGHLIGLAHNNATGSVMKVTLDSGDPRRTISKADSDSVHCEY